MVCCVLLFSGENFDPGCPPHLAGINTLDIFLVFVVKITIAVFGFGLVGGWVYRANTKTSSCS